MNVMYYRMVNGYGYLPSSGAAGGSTTPAAAAAGPPAPGLLGSGRSGLPPSPLGTAGATVAALPVATRPGLAPVQLPKWIVPSYTAAQLQYMVS